MTRLRRIVYLLVLTLMLSACNFSLVADVTPPPGYQFINQSNQDLVSDIFYPLVPPDPVKGKEIYLEECLPCHGRTGLGDGQNSASLPVPATAIGNREIVRQATPEEWFRVMTEGNLDRSMPSFKLLTDRQRWDAVAYALSLNASEKSFVTGTKLFDENCASCHGTRGDGRVPGASNPNVPNFTDQERMATKSLADFYGVITSGSGIEMPPYIDRFSEVERWDLAYYIRYLSFSPTAIGDSAQSTATLSSSDSNTHTIPATDLPESIATQKLGAITGTVIDASGKELPPGLAVTLHAFDQMQEVFTDTTVLKTNGVYLFDDIEMLEGRVFMTSIDYDGAGYFSDAVVVDKNQSVVDLSLKIYETTTDTTVLSVDRLHYFLEFIPGESSSDKDRIVRVVELHIISNNSTKTLIAPQKGQPVVSFSLPRGASNLELQDGNLGGRYILIPDGFGDTMQVLPGIGQIQVMFSYTVPYSRDSSLIWSVRLPIKALVILVPGNGIAIEGTGISDAGMRDIQGVQYHVYEGSRYSPGQELKLNITGPSFDIGAALPAGSGTDLATGLAVLLVSLTLALIWWLHRKHNEKPNIGRISDIPDRQSDEKPEAIMDAILALDDLFQRGSLSEDAHLQRRQELKSRLREILGS